MSDFSIALTGTEAVVTAGGVDIAHYVFDPGGADSEGPKPYMHPVRALDGAVLSAFRPWDHRWHKGLQMTWTAVSGQNFWGGPTYQRDTGYVQLDNVGRMRHDRFTTMTDAGDDVSFTEELTWITQAGDEWFTETRTHRFHGLDAARGFWMLDFATTLRNVSDRELELGSPTTEGRPNAGYTGFAIRMPRAWTGGRVLSADSDDADALMGAETAWLALSGEHDEVDGGGTVLVFAGVSTGAPAVRWFVRSEPFPIISPSASFDEPIVLAPGDDVSLSHRHVFLDSIPDADDVRALATELAP
ncbi:PmoA family protein [Microbacter sp. GSS18]|nr:PmoA family protein [Microbacter sp. GSS18]